MSLARRWENCSRCRATVERVETALGDAAHVDVLGGRHRCRLGDVLDFMLTIPDFRKQFERATSSRLGISAELLRARRQWPSAYLSAPAVSITLSLPRMAGKTYARAMAASIERERRRIELASLVGMPVGAAEEVERKLCEEFGRTADELRLDLARGEPPELCAAAKRYAARWQYERQSEVVFDADE